MAQDGEQLSLDAAHREVEALTTRILELRDAYYERDEVLVPDAEYDAMLRRLFELERLYPELQGQDSPTQTVGGRASTLFDPIRHAERMLSLDNVFSLEEFEAWAARIERDSGRAVDYLCELKIDGLAIKRALRARSAHECGDARRRRGRRGRDRERARDRVDPGQAQRHGASAAGGGARRDLLPGGGLPRTQC